MAANQSQGKRWVFTINNYTPEDQDRLRELECKYVVFGREVGENGTPHLQGFVIFDSNKRFNAAKTAIGATAHIELARGTSEQAAQYCRKENDYEEFGQLGTPGRRTDWERLSEWLERIGRRPTQRELIREFPSLYARYSHRVMEIVSAMQDPVRLVGEAEQPRDGWQRGLDEYIELPADTRRVRFYVDPVGNSGKTWMCQYLVSKHPDRVQVFRVGKRDDLAFAIDESKTIFLFDIPRKQMEYFQYSVIEQLKDRMVFSPKYNSVMKVLPAPVHVVVFCNEDPDMATLTVDRYDIQRLSVVELAMHNIIY